jgi:Arc/MetJ-type ribon-helix-helix transcriptional regulator
MSVPGFDDRDRRHAARAGRDAISAVKLSQQLTADIDAWAETHNMVRSDAIRQLVELGLDASQGPHRNVQREPADIEERAVEQIGRMLDPTLSTEERERRTRRLIEGPPEFSDQRIDLPKHER